MHAASMAILIPVVAIIMVFSIPIVAIIMDYRKRALQSAERKAMIEKGMVPPELEETENRWTQSRNPDYIRERSLRSGTILLFLGVGLAVAALALQFVNSFVPARVAGPLSVAAAITGFLGLGNLVYYWVSGKRQRAGADTPQ